MANHCISYMLKDGYAYFDCPEDELILKFDMTPFAVEASPHVQDNSDRIAIQRGPVIYCLEGVDNGIDLRDIHIDLTQRITVENNNFCSIPLLHAAGWRRDSAIYENVRPLLLLIIFRGNKSGQLIR